MSQKQYPFSVHQNMPSNSDLGFLIWWLYVFFSLLLSLEARESVNILVENFLSINCRKLRDFSCLVKTNTHEWSRWFWNFKIRIPLEKLLPVHIVIIVLSWKLNETRSREAMVTPSNLGDNTDKFSTLRNWENLGKKVSRVLHVLILLDRPVHKLSQSARMEVYNIIMVEIYWSKVATDWGCECKVQNLLFLKLNFRNDR